MTSKSYFSYVRVSTQRQGSLGTSLIEQQTAIDRYAERYGLAIVKRYEERETAARQGRPVFLEMLKSLKQGNANGIVVHKIDRSARNLKDWADLGALIDAGLEIHFANESLDLTSRGGRLSADIQAVVAADFIRNLREETKKGIYGRLRQGLYPFPARVGYVNIGKIVSAKVSEGIWGENTVEELAEFIKSKVIGLKGFNRRGLYRMKQFYETYSSKEFVELLENQGYLSEKERDKFVSSLLTQITWTHHLHLLSKTKTPEEKIFYLNLVVKEKLNTRDFERQLNSALFERTMLANEKVSALRTQSSADLTNLFKDPYIFEFLDLPDKHSENDLEKALVQNLKNFILEIGKGFTYLGNQYRLQVGNKDFHTDLLFFHRDLQCLVMFELKIQEFEPEFLGKLNFYLEALDRDVKRPFENPSIGVLLCKGKNAEVVEYALARSVSPAMIADYETKLIDKKILAEKLHQLIESLQKQED
jgi:predicted nuclease of restriction endonuclease-like (RecB) superfamily/DNA invertase Pin-like site-specific DNA recombinase